jgi:predicted transcriptional regulator
MLSIGRRNLTKRYSLKGCEIVSAKRAVVAINVYDRKVYKFDSIGEACKVLNVRHSEVYRVMKKERKSTGGFIFEPLNEYLQRRVKK